MKCPVCGCDHRTTGTPPGPLTIQAWAAERQAKWDRLLLLHKETRHEWRKGLFGIERCRYCGVRRSKVLIGASCHMRYGG